MRVRRALGTVLAVVGGFAPSACYSVPDLVEGGASTDAATRVDAEAGSPRDAASDGSPADGNGAEDARADGDATTCADLASCNNNLDCKGGCGMPVCAVSGTVANGVLAVSGGPFCTRPCCTSADCPAGTVCFASGEGGQYCVDPTWLGRGKPSANTTASGGTSCSTGADCRSGLCAGGTCQDTCCSLAQSSSSGQCAPPSLCVLGAFPGSSSALDTHFAPHCGPLQGASAQDQPCSADGDCQSGYCGTDYYGMKRCMAPCRNTGDCANAGDVCDYGQHGSDIVAACLPGSGGTSQEGASCDPNAMAPQCVAECGPNSQCTGVCFADKDCTYSGWACVPESVQFGGPTAPSYDILICGPP